MDPCQEKNKPRHASSSPPSPNYWPSSFHFASDVIVGIIRRIYFVCLASGLVHCSILSYSFMARWACVIHAFFLFFLIFFCLREELQDRMRGVYDIQYIYLTTQSVCVWPSEAAGHEYYTVFFFYFQTVLILWLNRFWPWVVLAKQFEFLFFLQHWVLFSISLCLWDMHVHHISEKVPALASKCCHIAMNSLLQTLACFFFLPPFL